MVVKAIEVVVTYLPIVFCHVVSMHFSETKMPFNKTCTQIVIRDFNGILGQLS